MWGGRLEMERRVSTVNAAFARAPSITRSRNVSVRGACVAARMSVRCERTYRLQDVGRIGKNRLFEHGCVRDRAIERSDTLDRRIEVLEQLLRHPRRNLRPEPARDLILVCDDHAAGLLGV